MRNRHRAQDYEIDQPKEYGIYTDSKGYGQDSQSRDERLFAKDPESVDGVAPTKEHWTPTEGKIGDNPLYEGDCTHSPVSLHRLELGVGDKSRKSQIRMVPGFAEAAETKYILVAAACSVRV